MREFASVATPKTEAVTLVGASTATFNGRLTPLNATEGSEYFFYYNLGEEGFCTNENATSPESAGAEAVSTAVMGLQPNHSYTVCLVAKNAFGSVEDVASPPADVKTLAAPPSVESETSSNLAPEAATLEATVNPNNQASTCQFEYSTKAALPAGAETKTVPCPAALGDGGDGVATSVALTGLQYHTPYYFRVDATNTTGETKDTTIATFETEATTAPEILPEVNGVSDLTASDVTETSATLNAQVNPNGAATTCQFEYGAEDGRSPNHVACAPQPGSGREAVSVTAPLTNLTPNTEYHWRLVAKNAAGATATPDQTFVYPITTATTEDREYEQVTPKEKNGALFNAFFGNSSGGILPQITSNGTSMIAISIQCLEGTPSCTAVRQQEGEPYEFQRTTAGWVTSPLAPPATSFAVNSIWGVDAQEHTVLFSAPNPEGGGDAFYARNAQGTITEIGPLGETAEGTTPHSGGTYARLGGIEATSSFSHVLYAGSKLWALAGAPEEHGLYEYDGSKNAAPVDVGVTGGQESSPSLISSCRANLASGTASGRALHYNSFAGDGSSVFFSAEPCSGGTGGNAGRRVVAEELFARVDGAEVGAHTVAISEPAVKEVNGRAELVPITAGSGPDLACSSPECLKHVNEEEPYWENAAFTGASSDGSHVFFTSTQQLTNTAVQGSKNLYLDDLAEPEGHKLIDVSAGSATPEVEGVLAVSPDGSHVYFVAHGVLTGTEENLEHEQAEANEPNLYVYSQPEARLRFVARLSPDDEEQWRPDLGFANVTSDGKYLVLTSHRALTADVMREEHTEIPAQVYRYDAETGVMVRVSIGQDGYNNNGNTGTGDAEIVPASSGYSLGVGPARADPTMSDNGEYVFFQSPIALAPGALQDAPAGVNGALAQNIYSYHNGTITLISRRHRHHRRERRRAQAHPSERPLNCSAAMKPARTCSSRPTNRSSLGTPIPSATFTTGTSAPQNNPAHPTHPPRAVCGRSLPRSAQHTRVLLDTCQHYLHRPRQSGSPVRDCTQTDGKEGHKVQEGVCKE